MVKREIEEALEEFKRYDELKNVLLDYLLMGDEKVEVSVDGGQNWTPIGNICVRRMMA